jgi:hypothetical protein
VEGSCEHGNEPILSLKRRPHFKTCESLEKKLWSWVPMGLESKNDSAGEGPQQFNRPTDRVAERLATPEEGLSFMELVSY